MESLTASLEEETEYRTSLEERLESLDDKNDEIIAKIIKDRDHALAKYKVIKKEKAEFVAANARLVEEKEKLEKALKALEVTHSTLVKSHEQLQTQSSKSDSPSTSTILCDHANVIEENARLKSELANYKGKGPVIAPLPTQKAIVDPLVSQRPYNSKEEGLWQKKHQKKQSVALSWKSSDSTT